MHGLEQSFITSRQPYREGAVLIFHQRYSVSRCQRTKLMITALDVYEAELNRQKIGDQLFAPGYTDEVMAGLHEDSTDIGGAHHDR